MHALTTNSSIILELNLVVSSKAETATRFCLQRLTRGGDCMEFGCVGRFHRCHVVVVNPHMFAYASLCTRVGLIKPQILYHLL
ncbi:hypothetical protein N665_0583s0004 [Sinapis alba]|nr:hypothetical protein N665_0583s0004 [Sinapis alba]